MKRKRNPTEAESLEQIKEYVNKLKDNPSNTSYKKIILVECQYLYGDQVLFYIIPKVPDISLAQDLRQNVFLKFYELRTSKLILIEDFKNYLFRIATNCVSDYHNNRKKLNIVSIEDAASVESPVNKFDDDSLLLDKIRQFLTAEQFAVVKLRSEDFSHADIYKILDLPSIAASMMLYRRAKQKLRKIGAQAFKPHS